MNDGDVSHLEPGLALPRFVREPRGLPGLGRFIGDALRRGLRDLVAHVFRRGLIRGHRAAGAQRAQRRVRQRHGVRQCFAVDGSRGGNGG